MKNFIRFLCLCFTVTLTGSLGAQVSESDRSFVNGTLYKATALLYSQSFDGAMNMRCTATAIEKDDSGYTFVTAAHCVCSDDTTKVSVSPDKTYFFITADESVSKDFMRAKPVACGYRHRGDDFALLHVETKSPFPVIPLGHDPALLDHVVNVAGPNGLGKQVFFGSVSSPTLNRPVVEGNINWGGAVLLQMFGVNGGSSGSAIVCLEQRAICAFIVGSIEQTNMTAMPVSRLVKLRESYKAGTYKWWKPDPDAPTEGKP